MPSPVLPLLLLLAACGSTPAAPPGVAGACVRDADCAPAQCCHPTSCVPRADAPDCTGVACTLHCAPGTMDCGGRCVCRDGRCEAILARPSASRDELPAR